MEHPRTRWSLWARWPTVLTNIVIPKIPLNTISFVNQDLTQAYLEGTHRLVRFHFLRKRVLDRWPRERKLRHPKLTQSESTGIGSGKQNGCANEWVRFANYARAHRIPRCCRPYSWVSVGNSQSFSQSMSLDIARSSLEDKGERGRVRRSAVGHSIVSQMNTGTVSKATLGKIPRDGVESMWAVPSA